jgi:GNAT superfamily N-acetyltransferase
MTAGVALGTDLRAGSDLVIRPSAPSDNGALIDLAATCAMEGDVSMRIDRGPDFLALNRLEGDRWTVGVAERRGQIVGCVAMSERRAFINGREARTGYVGDLKVHPAHRDTRVADALSLYAESLCASLPPAAPVLITVLAGNEAMERRLSGPRGVPAFTRAATIRTYSIPILWRRTFHGHQSITITSARWSDLEEMISLWNTVAPGRQFAPVLSAGSLADWIRHAPGLDISSYSLARSSRGELLGFLAVWNQRSFKQLTVLSYSPRMKLAKMVFNALSHLAGAEPLPGAGSPLGCVTIANICVPAERSDVLRELLASTHNELRSTGCSFMNVGLDTRDPLCRAMVGLLAQPTDVNAYTVTSRSGVRHEPLDGRPMHYEIALV